MLYTRKGDQGTTTLFGASERIQKSDVRVAALGNLDELNAWLGLCAARLAAFDSVLSNELRSMQEDVCSIQACVAGAFKKPSRARVLRLERLIARVEKEIPPIRSFVILGRTESAGYLDVARAVARRAERSLIAIDDQKCMRLCAPYLNRLSSALYALARLLVLREGVSERAPSY